MVPVKYSRRLGGRFVFQQSALLVGNEEADRLPLRQLARDLAGLGISGRIRLRPPGNEAPAIRVLRDSRVTDPEGYELMVRPSGIELRARTAAGAYYGVQTLRELLALHGRTLPALSIRDWPDLRRRAVYHDCSRGKVPKVRTICELVERLARWKINELQLYIENTFRFRRHPAIGVGYSPFTAQDITRIQAHCKRHHVRLVGSLASFGHMEKILVLPEYRHLAELPELDAAYPRGDLCPTDPRSIRFLAELYEEFLPLFEAEDFNACCDETSHIGTGRSRRRAERIGVGRLYLEFVLKIRRLCLKHGKRMNIWGDIVLAHPELIPEIPKDVVMLNWDYNPNGRRIDRTNEFAEAGLPLMCCPGTNGWQSHGTRMAQANANITKFARLARQYGAEGLLNTDWGDYGHRNTLGVSLHGFALGAACAWGGARLEGRGLGRFTRSFTFHVFGDRAGRLAEALRTLGAWPGSQLYHALIEPFDQNGDPQSRHFAVGGPGRILGHRTIASPNLKSPAVRRRLEVVRSLRFAAPKPAQEFEALALEEFELARRMDLLACRRILAGRQLLGGGGVPARELRAIGRDMEALAEDFARLWRRRNRPSRLRDNLAAMRAASAEAYSLARR